MVKPKTPLGSVAVAGPSLWGEDPKKAESVTPVTDSVTDPQAPAGPADLTALRDDQRATAATVTVDEATLATWYEWQIGTSTAKRDRWHEAQAVNIERLRGPDDPNWARWYAGEVRATYWDEAVMLLEKRRHCLVCPTHGIEGLAETAPIADGLSLRGALTGEGAMAWTRYCVECAPLKSAAETAYEAHRAARMTTREESIARTARIRAENAARREDRARRTA